MSYVCARSIRPSARQAVDENDFILARQRYVSGHLYSKPFVVNGIIRTLSKIV